MTKNELIKSLEDMDGDKVVIITKGKGWCNIEDVTEMECQIEISGEQSPVFTD